MASRLPRSAEGVSVLTRLSDHWNRTPADARRAASSTRHAKRISLPGILIVAMCVLSPCAARAAGQSVWQLTPYEVQVFVALGAQPPLSPKLETELCAGLAAHIERVVGAQWNATVSAAPPGLRKTMLAGLETMQADQMAPPSPEIDKILFLTVTSSHGDVTLTARDFDVRTRILSPAVVRSVRQLGALGNTAFDALLSAFAPLARVEPADRGQAVLHIKAAGLPTRDPTLVTLHQDDVFQPILRHNDREGQFRRAAPVPWTFCTVTAISPEEVRCRVHSATRATLATRGRGRVESLALRVVPPSGSTTLLLQSRTEPKTPLAAYDVFSHPPDQKTTTFLGRTDRQGRLVVPPAENLIRVLLIKNGGESLARLVLVPGLEPQMTAEIVNDDRRLAAEGFIIGLQGELVDTVTRREILMARIRARIEAQEADEARALLDELRRLPKKSQFVVRLARERDRLASNDPVIQRKIDALVSDTRQLIDKHLETHNVEELERQLQSTKNANGN